MAGENGTVLVSEKDRERIRSLRLMDDLYMSKFFENNIPCTQLMLRVILGRNDLVVREVHVQYSITNLQGRSVRLDVLAEDADHVLYEVEVQRDPVGADPRRARYISAMLDVNSTHAGESHQELREIYVIFLTETDVLGMNHPLYRIERVILNENGENVPFHDGSHIIYVNGAYSDEPDSPLGLLIHDFLCTEPGRMHYRELAERAHYLKENEEGVREMSGIFQELWLESEKKACMENARRLLSIGKLTPEEIAFATGLTIEEIRELANGKTA